MVLWHYCHARVLDSHDRGIGTEGHYSVSETRENLRQRVRLAYIGLRVSSGLDGGGNASVFGQFTVPIGLESRTRKEERWMEQRMIHP